MTSERLQFKGEPMLTLEYAAKAGVMPPPGSGTSSSPATRRTDRLFSPTNPGAGAGFRGPNNV